MYVCRLVCSITPLRASSRTTAASAVDAPVTMLRVYWTCPGASASWKRRVGVTNERYATSIVMPCSRSALSPSVSSARLTYPSPRRSLVASMCSHWSTKTCFVSKRSRPISVDLPSSTEPHVTRRSSSDSAASPVSSSARSGALTLAVALGRCWFGSGCHGLGPRAALFRGLPAGGGIRAAGIRFRGFPLGGQAKSTPPACDPPSRPR